MSNTFIVDRPTESTHKEIAAALRIMAANTRKELSDDWEGLAALADTGLFGEAYGIGDQFIDTWKDAATNAEYTYPFQLNHIGTVELEDAESLSNRPFLQAHYAHPFGVQFSHQRAFLRCPSGLAAGTYYVTIESAWGTHVSAGDIVCFTTTVAVPAGGRVAGMYGAPDQAKSNWRIYTFSADGKTILETITPTFTASGTSLGTIKASVRNGDLNSMQETAYGNNNWEISAYRQYLNSRKGKGEWWTAQDEWDIAPDQLNTVSGFLCGISDELYNSMQTVKVKTWKNNPTHGGVESYTYDKVFLPSKEELYYTPQKAGEGTYYPLMKEQLGLDSPLADYTNYAPNITYAIENHSSAQVVRLRSAYLSNANGVWSAYASGDVGYGNASGASRCAPVCVIG